MQYHPVDRCLMPPNKGQDTEGDEGMLVRDFMTPEPVALLRTDTLQDAVRLFFRYRVNGAPVVDEKGCVVGLITNAHLVETMMTGLPVSTPVDQVMTKNVITISADAMIEEARHIPVSRLPVVSKENKLIGIMTRQNFAAAFYAAMSRTKDKVETLIDISHDGTVIINNYGAVTAWSSAVARLTGVTEQEAVGRHILELLPGISLLRVLSTGERDLGKSVEIKGQFFICNNAPIREGTKIVGAMAVFQDLSELTQARRQLTDIRQEIDLMNNLYEHTSRGMIVVDKNSIILKVNAAYEEIMGISAEDAIGRTAMEALENTRLHIVLQTGISELGEIQSQQGRQVIVNRIPLFDEAGQIIGALGEAVFKDIKEISSLLERLRERAQSVPIGKPVQVPRVDKSPFDNIIGRSRPMVQVKNLSAKASFADNNVMITGESGTGKDLFAQAIHNASFRRDKPFVAVNCAAIPSDLLESELFGYEEGAFTGAKRGGKKGKFEIANHGTIFLDEIGDMPLAMQAKLLRVIEEQKVEKVGGLEPLTIDVRIIAATNKPLMQMIERGTFREDLYYRLNVISLRIPALRERHEDIGELLVHIMRGICEKRGQTAKQFAPETLQLLNSYHWPGNVRELINLIEQVMTTVSGPIILPKHLPSLQWKRQALAQDKTRAVRERSLEEDAQEILEMLDRAKGNKALAAKLLGIHRSTLYEKMKKYNIN